MQVMLAAILLAQDAALAERLKRDGWKAVEELAAQPKLKPDLEKLAGSDDAELKWWAGAALAEIDARACGIADFENRRVTLEAKERPAHEVLAQLLAPDGLRLTGPQASAPITVSFKSAPVLAALDEVCRQAGCALRRKPNDEIEAQPDRSNEIGRPIQYAGPQAFLVGDVTHRTVTDFAGEPRQDLHLRLTVRGDPRAWMPVEPCGWKIVSAVDDTGRSLSVESDGGSKSWSGGVQPPSISLSLEFSAPAREARRIARLRGIATLALSRKPEEIVFTDVLKDDQTREVRGIKVTLKKVTLEDREYRVRLEAAGKGAPSPRFMLRQARLEDAGGGGFFEGGGVSAEGESLLLKSFRAWDKDRVPVRVRVTLLPDAYGRTVYFEIKDIPIR